MELRIREIRVEGLFGMFDHVIPLNLDSHITIVYGENGIGKTMIFRILDALLRKDLAGLSRFPFGRFSLMFEGGDEIGIKRRQDLKLDFDLMQLGKRQKVSVHPQSQVHPAEFIETVVGKNELVGLILELHTWGKNTDQLPKMLPELLKLSQSGTKKAELKQLKRVARLYPDFFIEKIKALTLCPEEIADMISGIKCYFIGTERIDFLEYVDSELDEELIPKRTPSVSTYSEELLALIQKAHYKYQKRTEELEGTLQSRLAHDKVRTEFSALELQEIVTDVAMLRIELSKLGLLDETKIENIPIEGALNPISRAIMGVSLLDMKARLAVYDEMHAKLRLLLTMVNERRFSFKKLSIHPEKGFQITAVDGQPLELTDLSTGEQHELIFLFLLIFKVPQNSLVLLDEPEISLHLDWQMAFIDDMSEIIKLRGFDLIAATHSPAIINGKWDYTVALTSESLVNV